MDIDIQAQIRALQTSVRRQRVVNLLLTGALAAAVCSLAPKLLEPPPAPAAPAQPPTCFDNLTCHRLTVVDQDGKARIVADAMLDGDVAIHVTDRNDRTRVSMGVSAIGDASVQCLDKDEQVRVGSMTNDDGEAISIWTDKTGSDRVTIGSFDDGKCELR